MVEKLRRSQPVLSSLPARLAVPMGEAGSRPGPANLTNTHCFQVLLLDPAER